MDALQLTLPVEELPAKVILSDGQQRDARLFIAPGRDAHGVLEATQPFVRAAEEEGFRLYGRDAIACLSVPAFRAPRDEGVEGLPVHRQRIQVHLVGGVHVSGEVRYLAPPERSRPGDYLNEDCVSFSLYDGEVVHFVVKRHVIAIEEVTV